MRFSLIAAFFLIMGCSTAQTKNSYLKPVDQSQEDPTFKIFVQDLKTAIAQKDSHFIKKILASDVQYTFGGDLGRKSAREGFMKYYNVSNPQSDFWKHIARVLELGCKKTESHHFVCPSLYSLWDIHLNVFSYAVSTHDNTPLYKEPNNASPVIQKASYEILKLAQDQKNQGWYTIDLGSDKRAYIQEDQAWSPIDYRMEFNRVGSGWEMEYFIAGE